MDDLYYTGTITLFAYNFTPRSFFQCNGQILQISAYQALYSLIKDNYGGDGITTFALPNMLGLEPYPGMNYYICYSGTIPPPSNV
jgi:microcystin-dependent protein